MQLYDTICSWKLRVMRKAVLNGREMACRYDCDGNAKTCESYNPIEREVPLERPDFNKDGEI